MNDLAKHIEALLVDNDCVIVPGVGGFIIHYTPAVWIKENETFLPPTRMTGFNSRLKVNDGLLVQSYMTTHHTDFSKATKLMEKDVDELISALHAEGKIVLENIGQLKLSIRDMLEFTPCTASLCTPALYGWGRLGIQKLKAETPFAAQPSSVHQVVKKDKEKSPAKVRINAPFWSNVAAVISIIILCLALSIPVENTEVIKGNYAQLLPTEAFRQMGQQSLTITPLAVQEAKVTKVEVPKPEVKKAEVEKVDIKSIEVKKTTLPKAEPKKVEVEKTKTAEKKSARRSATTTSPLIYHIIIASVGTAQDARNMAQTLTEQGFKNAQAIIGDGKMRVCIDSYASEAEAYRALNRYRENEVYKNAWVLKKK